VPALTINLFVNNVVSCNTEIQALAATLADCTITMKFWELTSAFREEPNILHQVLTQDQWVNYYKHYKRLDEIVQNQERDILDEELPFDPCYEVAIKSKQEFWLSFNEQPQVLYSYRPSIDNLERLLPNEILVRFGGDKIEDAHDVVQLMFIQDH